MFSQPKILFSYYNKNILDKQGTWERSVQRRPFEEPTSRRLRRTCLLYMTSVKHIKGASSRSTQKMLSSKNLWQIILLSWRVNIPRANAPALIETLLFELSARWEIKTYRKIKSPTVVRYILHYRQFLSVAISDVECQSF